MILEEQQKSDQQIAEEEAANIKSSIVAFARDLVNRWAILNSYVWQGEPDKVALRLNAIGTDGAEIAALSNSLVAFMNASLASRPDLIAKIQEELSKIPAFSIAADGKITLS